MTSEIKPVAIIMDLDGTLCDGSKFLHLGDHAYHEACVSVAPVNPKMAEVVRDASNRDIRVIVLTGRSEVWQKDGWGWLERVGLIEHVDEFYSRPRGDWRPNAEFKRDVTKRLQRPYDILRAYDDDPRNILMFRKLGIDAVEVGDFDWRLA